MASLRRVIRALGSVSGNIELAVDGEKIHANTSADADSVVSNGFLGNGILNPITSVVGGVVTTNTMSSSNTALSKITSIGITSTSPTALPTGGTLPNTADDFNRHNNISPGTSFPDTPISSPNTQTGAATAVNLTASPNTATLTETTATMVVVQSNATETSIVQSTATLVVSPGSPATTTLSAQPTTTVMPPPQSPADSGAPIGRTHSLEAAIGGTLGGLLSIAILYIILRSCWRSRHSTRRDSEGGNIQPYTFETIWSPMFIQRRSKASLKSRAWRQSLFRGRSAPPPDIETRQIIHHGSHHPGSASIETVTTLPPPYETLPDQV